MQDGELTLKLLNLFFDSVTKFQNMDTVLQPVFYELIAKTVQQLHISRDKEGFLDLLLNLFRTIQVSNLMFSNAICGFTELNSQWQVAGLGRIPEHLCHIGCFDPSCLT